MRRAAAAVRTALWSGPETRLRAPWRLAVGGVAVVVLSEVVGAAAVYALLRRRTGEPARTFRRVAAVVLALSLLPDLGLLVADSAATPLGVVVLMAMHVVVAGISVRLLPAGD